MLSDVEKEKANRAARSLKRFIRLAWPILEPATEFVDNWHIGAITEHLEAVSAGQIRNLLINVPPRHMKSLTVGVCWPMWEWLTNPQRRWLFASYAANLSIRDSLKCRRIIESPWFQSRYGDRFSITSDQNQKTRFDNDRTGYRIATSVGGWGTGEGGDRVVVDDPHNAIERESDPIREAVLTWWDETMSTRLNDPKKGAKVIVMQRLHEKDLSGHVLAQGGYEHLCLPAEFEPSRRCVTSIGWEDPRNKENELLWHERVGPAEIADFKIRLGPIGYAGQFQQRPTPAGGARFHKDWFSYYTREGSADKAGVVYRITRNEKTWRVSEDECRRFAIMDPAGTEKEQNNKPCYTVIQVWDVTPSHDMLLLDQFRGQIETPDAAEAAIAMVRRWNAGYLAVEKDGIGLGVVQTIRRRGIAVRGIKARGSKEARSETAEILMAARRIHFPKGASFLWDLEQELLHFPRGEYADQVDALAHAAMIVHHEGGAPRDESGREYLDDNQHDRKLAAKTSELEDAGRPGRSIDPQAVSDAAQATDSDVAAWLAGEDV